MGKIGPTTERKIVDREQAQERRPREPGELVKAWRREGLRSPPSRCEKNDLA